MSAFLLQLVDAEISFRRDPVLSGVNLEVCAGDFLAVVGANGSGKSTLLRSLLGSLPLRAGARHERPGLVLGYVPQELALEREHPLTALDVTAMGGWGPAGARLPPRKALAIVELESSADRRFAELSGGQKQRVLLARSLVARPDLILLDEPASAADVRAARALYVLLGELATGGAAVVLVTHHLEAVAGLATRVVRVAAGRVHEETPSSLPR